MSEPATIESELCRDCLPGRGRGLSLALVFGLWNDARFVRLSVAHKWHLLNAAPARRNETMCGRQWGGR